MKDLVEVCPLSRAGYPAICSITEQPLLSPHSCTHLSFGVPYGSLSLRGERWVYHVPIYDQDRLGAVYSPVVFAVAVERNCILSTLPTSHFGSSLSASLACSMLRRLSTVHICSPYRPPLALCQH